MAKCSKNSGRVKFLRGNSSATRYVGICDDCGFSTDHGSLNATVFELDVHFGNLAFNMGKKGMK